MTEKKVIVEDDIIQLVVFHMMEEKFAIDIQCVQEIIRMQNITKMPKTLDFVEGVINLRGKVIPVIDLRKRFELENKKDDENTRIVVVEVSGIVIGMVVDSVSHVIRLSERSIEPTSPVVSNVSSDFILGVGKLDDELIIILDVEKIFEDHEKEHLSIVAGSDEDKVEESAEE